MHDLIDLAEECARNAKRLNQITGASQTKTLYGRSAAALREAHAEIASLRAELEAAKALVKRHEDALWNMRIS